MMMHWREEKKNKNQPTLPAKWSKLNTKSLLDKITWPKKVPPTPSRSSRHWQRGLCQASLPSCPGTGHSTFAPNTLTHAELPSSVLSLSKPSTHLYGSTSLLSHLKSTCNSGSREKSLPALVKPTDSRVKSIKSKGGIQQCAFLPSAPSGLWCRLVLGPFPEARIVRAVQLSPGLITHLSSHLFARL